MSGQKIIEGLKEVLEYTKATDIERLRAALHGRLEQSYGLVEISTDETRAIIAALEAAATLQPAMGGGWKDDVNKAITDAETSLTARCTMAWNGNGHLGDARDVARSVWGTFCRLREDLKLPPYQRPQFDELSVIPERPSTDEETVERVAKAIATDELGEISNEKMWTDLRPGYIKNARAAIAVIQEQKP